MKRYSLLLFLFVSLVTTAQVNVYHPFPGLASAPVWRTEFSAWVWPSCAFTGPSADYQYTFTGDTTIGSYTYHKVDKSGVVMIGACFWGPPFGYRGAIREDVAAKRIYIVPADSTREALLYDFSLSIGDTLHTIIDSLVFGSGSPPEIVTGFDSVQTSNGYRKRLLMNNGASAPIIEGIGGVYGLLDPLYVFESGGNLLCYSDTATNWFNPQYTGNPQFGCFLGTGSETKNLQLHISPNPAADALRLETGAYADWELELLNAQGQLIARQRFTGQEQLIDLKQLPPGLYSLFVGNTEQRFSARFIKE